MECSTCVETSFVFVQFIRISDSLASMCNTFEVIYEDVCEASNEKQILRNDHAHKSIKDSCFLRVCFLKFILSSDIVKLSSSVI
jgi:hypothetical protein